MPRSRVRELCPDPHVLDKTRPARPRSGLHDLALASGLPRRARVRAAVWFRFFAPLSGRARPVALREKGAMMARTQAPGKLFAPQNGGIMTEFYVRPDGMPPGNGYSHAVAFTGRAVIISGQLPLDGDGKLAGTEPETQMRQVFQNLSVALAAAGAGMAEVVKLTVYLTDLADLPAFRRVRDEYLSADRPPASSLVRVAGLVHPEARVEIEALAVTSPA
jgi:enamine deaminase RidA (YjgF/YER057c/UK114 family)